MLKLEQNHVGYFDFKVAKTLFLKDHIDKLTLFTGLLFYMESTTHTGTKFCFNWLTAQVNTLPFNLYNGIIFKRIKTQFSQVIVHLNTGMYF